jgi:trimeric autotransporter adhesin
MKAHRAQAIWLCLGLLSACGGGSLAPGVGGSSGGSSRSPSLQSIQVAPSAPSVALGLDQQFTATGLYSDGSTKNITASVVWASSNASVVTISSSGFATSRATGSVTVSATLSGVEGYGTLTVTKAILVSITITPANPDVLLATLQQFTATGTFSDQSSQDITGSVTWASSNDSMLSFQGGGLAAALALGSLTISATSGSISASTAVNVASSVLSSITIRPGNGKIAQLTSQQFEAIGTYTDGATRYVSGTVSWTSSNATVATIADSGLARGLVPGTTTITATSGSITASTTLEVTDATIVSLSLRPSGETIAPGTELGFTAIGSFSDNSTQVITIDCTWSSDNHAVATVGSGGLATAVGPGTANISATFYQASGSAPLYVSSATIASISVTPVAALLTPATSVNCVATGTFSDGSTQVITNVVNWTSSASTVASVSIGGSVTAHSSGTATITAQFGPVTGDSTIIVESSQLTSIQISPPTASIAQQAAVAFHAIGTFADGSTQDLTTFALWTSSPPSVATITYGRASGLEPGTATIVALFDGQIGIADLTVTSATPTSQSVPPAAINFEPGGFTQFTAVADLSDGTTPKELKPRVPRTSSANLAAITLAGRPEPHRGGNDYGDSHHERSEGNSCSESSLPHSAPRRDQYTLFPESI